MNSRVRSTGFTLIEILVVVAIVAIVTAVATLSLGVIGDDNDARTEARRLASLIEVAQDEAMMQGREFGLELLAGGYRFVEFDPFSQSWADIPGDDVLRPRNLTTGLFLDLYMEDKLVPLEEELAELGQDEDDDRRLKKYAPHSLIFSSGDMTPFRVHIARGPAVEPIVLTVGALGQTAITSGDER